MPQQTCHDYDQNIIHDAFMDTDNFFSNTGFASGPRGYAVVAQMNIRSNFYAFNDLNLTDMSPMHR